MKFEIAKEFDFCYGHRVWSQDLDVKFSLSSCNKCRHLHGHEGKIIIHLSSEKLQNAMVTDFNHLSWFKEFLDSALDHRFIIDRRDPLFDKMLGGVDLVRNEWGFWVVDMAKIANTQECEKEYFESFVVVDFVPTSENLSSWILGIVNKKMHPLGVNVSSVEFFETPRSRSIVYA